MTMIGTAIKSVRKKLKLRSRRRYPIRRDESGRSARRRCFELFDAGHGPKDASTATGVSIKTAQRYFQSWKKQPKNLQARYELLQTLRKTHPEFTQQTINWLAVELDLTEEQVIERLDDVQKPWGIKRLVQGDWVRYVMGERQAQRQEKRSEAEKRLLAALELICLHEHYGVPLDRTIAAFGELRDEYKDAKPNQEGRRQE